MMLASVSALMRSRSLEIWRTVRLAMRGRTESRAYSSSVEVRGIIVKIVKFSRVGETWDRKVRRSLFMGPVTC